MVLYSYIYIYICIEREGECVREHDSNSGSVWRDYGEAGEEKRMIVWIMSKYIASVYEDSITKCIENSWIIGQQGYR
jgi:hypothetical protein